MRIGGESKHKRAVKVWEKREFKNLDNTKELGTRNIKMALRRLRRFAREGAADEAALLQSPSSLPDILSRDLEDGAGEEVAGERVHLVDDVLEVLPRLERRELELGDEPVDLVEDEHRHDALLPRLLEHRVRLRAHALDRVDHEQGRGWDAAAAG